MKVVFMGSDPIALPLLEVLAQYANQGIELTAIFTQPDRPTGRGMKLQPNEIKQWAAARGIAVHQPERCGPADRDWIAAQRIDLVLVMAYGQILKRSFLEVPPLGVLNFHASLLPRLRGASPIHTAIAQGLTRSGVSLMRIIPALDAGPVADAEPVEIAPEDHSHDLHRKLATASARLLERNLPAIRQQTLTFTGQDPQSVTYCRIIEKSDAQLDFAAPASDLANRVRAFQPWPGTAFSFNQTEIRIREAAAIEETSPAQSAPGTVVRSDDTLLIACGKGCLKPIQLQRPGGKAMPTADFLRGFPIPVGSVLPSHPMRPLEAPEPFPWKSRG